MPDVELLQLTLKIVEQADQLGTIPIEVVDDPFGVVLEAPPEYVSWNQGAWVNMAHLTEGFCLTAGCVAGHVVMREGFTEPWVVDGTLDGVRNPITGQVLDFSNGECGVPGYAQRRLGLDHNQAERLFNGGNTLTDLQRIVGELCEEADE